MKPRITLITLGVGNLESAVAFYRDRLGLQTQGIIGTEFEYGAVAFFDLEAGLRGKKVFKFGNTLVNLLKTAAPGELIERARVAPADRRPQDRVDGGVKAPRSALHAPHLVPRPVSKSTPPRSTS